MCIPVQKQIVIFVALLLIMLPLPIQGEELDNPAGNQRSVSSAQDDLPACQMAFTVDLLLGTAMEAHFPIGIGSGARSKESEARYSLISNINDHLIMDVNSGITIEANGTKLLVIDSNNNGAIDSAEELFDFTCERGLCDNTDNVLDLRDTYKISRSTGIEQPILFDLLLWNGNVDYINSAGGYEFTSIVPGKIVDANGQTLEENLTFGLSSIRNIVAFNLFKTQSDKNAGNTDQSKVVGQYIEEIVGCELIKGTLTITRKDMYTITVTQPVPKIKKFNHSGTIEVIDETTGEIRETIDGFPFQTTHVTMEFVEVDYDVSDLYLKEKIADIKRVDKLSIDDIFIPDGLGTSHSMQIQYSQNKYNYNLHSFYNTILAKKSDKVVGHLVKIISNTNIKEDFGDFMKESHKANKAEKESISLVRKQGGNIFSN